MSPALRTPHPAIKAAAERRSWLKHRELALAHISAYFADVAALKADVAAAAAAAAAASAAASPATSAPATHGTDGRNTIARSIGGASAVVPLAGHAARSHGILAKLVDDAQAENESAAAELGAVSFGEAASAAGSLSAGESDSQARLEGSSLNAAPVPTISSGFDEEFLGLSFGVAAVGTASGRQAAVCGSPVSTIVHDFAAVKTASSAPHFGLGSTSTLSFESVGKTAAAPSSDSDSLEKAPAAGVGVSDDAAAAKSVAIYSTAVQQARQRFREAVQELATPTSAAGSSREAPGAAAERQVSVQAACDAAHALSLAYYMTSWEWRPVAQAASADAAGAPSAQGFAWWVVANELMCALDADAQWFRVAAAPKRA